MFTILGGSCSNGPCPTAHIDREIAQVKVQGYDTEAGDIRLPPGESLVAMPLDAFERILADLPVTMLLRALVAPWRFRTRSRDDEALTPAGR